MHACVVEGTGDDCHRDRTCPAAADRAFIIAALPGGDTADDQPDGKKYRSDVHLDLRGIVCIDTDETAISISVLCLGPASPGSIPAVGDSESSAAKVNIFSRNLEVGLAMTAG
jgi:hypothetical protein